MTSITYRSEIDGLRAVAIVPVVLYHAGVSWLPGGFVGVDVFFVISGYLITLVLAQDWQATGRIDLLAFYARRVRRLWPALIAVLAVTALAGLIVLVPLGRWYGFADSTVASALFLANFHFEQSTGGYFDAAAEKQPLLHLWSLAVEEQFYLVYPLLLMVLLRFPPGRRVSVLAGLSLGSLLLAEYWLSSVPVRAFYMMPSRFWELAIGGIVALAPQRDPGARWSVALVLLGLAAVSTSMLTLDTSRFPGFAALFSVAGAGLVLHAIHSGSRLGWAGALLSSRPMVFFGLISYSLYLWHWPILVLDGVGRLEPAGTTWRLLLCMIAVGVSWASYRWIEQPFRRAKGIPSGRVIRAGLLGSALVAAGVMALSSVGADFSTADLSSRARMDRPPDIASCHMDMQAEVARLPPPACQSDGSGQYARVVIWGDSHALAWKPFAWGLGERLGVPATAYTMDGCPPVTGFNGTMADTPGFSKLCAGFNSLALDQVVGGNVDVLVLAARWPGHFGHGLASREEAGRAPRAGRTMATPEALEAGLRHVVESAAPHVRQIFLLAPTPVLHYEAPDCIATRRLHECALARHEFEAGSARSRDLLLDIASGYPNVVVVDPAAFFCTADECPALKDGYALFWDDDHVSSTAARRFLADFMDDPGPYMHGMDAKLHTLKAREPQ